VTGAADQEHNVEQDFDSALSCLTEPALSWLATGLAELDLSAAERQAVLTGTGESVRSAVGGKVNRLLLLEFNAARVTGQLSAEDGAGRWAEFVDRASRIDYWTLLEEHYPTLLHRLAALISGRASAGLEFARRFAANRGRFGPLGLPAQPELTEVSFGAGDTHRGGRSVAMVTLAEGRLVYKPRPLGVDVALACFLDRLWPGVPAAERIRLPAVLNCATYGWSEFIEHRYCQTSDELASYYRRIGHWLALARLFGTTDLHAENLIACAATPIVVDCETLFTPRRMVKPSGVSDALDRAAALLNGTLLDSGLLPGRGIALGWRGADISASGALPGQQPLVALPQIVAAGSDQARLEMVELAPPQAANLPSPKPDLHRYWAEVLAGFDELTARLHELDRVGWLDDAFATFGDVDVRVVLRSTEAYAELGRMLWHPVSLHDEPAAVERASTLLAKHSESNPAAPSDPAVIAGEVANLLLGDIPYYRTTPSTGWLRGPTDHLGYGEPHDVLAETLDRWRTADLAAERELIRTSVVCAYRNDGFRPEGRVTVESPTLADLDPRRRRIAAGAVERLVRTAIRGDDGTVTWIAPVMSQTGWSVQPLNPDAYSGLPGVALALAGYQHEVAARRADPVAGLPELTRAAVDSMRALDTLRTEQQSDYRARPESPGLYLGLGSQIWCWTALAELGALDPAEALRRATGCAELLPAALDGYDQPELLDGWAGAIVGLLRLSDRTGDGGWLELAAGAGERLLAAARWQQDQVHWSTDRWPDGLGGVAHGATGIGWALARLSQATGRADLLAVADAAFAFEESLWDPAEGGWRDLRGLDDQTVTAAWCHGAVGIGLVSADLLRRGLTGTPHAEVLRRAAESSWQHGFGWSHPLCHGDLGGWEMLATAFELGLAPAGLTRAEVDGYLLTSLEQHGPASGRARSASVPGLMSGLGGIAYQLLRMHPDCPLPSVLVID
jgi:type 2 lantibiotic biosynthesis protein LanM